jgi:glucose-1-phosphate thymidylyltransferase
MRVRGKLDVVALVPAAGQGHRVAPLPCSKELYPIGFRHDTPGGEPRPKVASHYLFEKFCLAGITYAYVIVRHGKWDIPAYFGDGGMLGMHLAYLVIGESLGPPDTLDRAYPFVNTRSVAFGFPDILFGPDDVFVRLLERQRATGADIVLGLYRAHDCRLMDMVDVDEAGRVRAITLKPPSSNLRYAWICAVWTPAFTECMHGFLASERAKSALERTAYRTMDRQGDLPVGAVIKFALESGLRIHGLAFPDETYLDIGTPTDLVKAVALHAQSGPGGRP